MNLYSNALKGSPDPGNFDVTVKLATQDDTKQISIPVNVTAYNTRPIDAGQTLRFTVPSGRERSQYPS